MLTQDEELWAKELPPPVEKLLQEARDPLADRSDRSGMRTCCYSLVSQRDLACSLIQLQVTLLG